ncbi:MAG: NAD-dependent protein deacetylase [Deltaproteobacteria bacterium]|nr:MAG: NAD-dependent protein deacetylase [Deltaproteobacteria bacterium]
MSVDALAELFEGRRIAVLTGAGLSTASGIPDYRGPGTLARARNPIQYREFVDSDATRRRYWARSTVGWQRVAAAAPNLAHRALAALEERGRTTGLITQNVDRLHHRAGSRGVVELHGALEEVVCLSCGALSSRAALQQALVQLNPRFAHRTADFAPDGDAELDDTADFRIPACACGGVLKPHVVFFGESVPRPRVDRAFSLLRQAEGLLVAGTSLAVFSGYRFVREAAAIGLPIGVVNLGPSRGDAHANVRVDGPVQEVLPALVERL